MPRPVPGSSGTTMPRLSASCASSLGNVGTEACRSRTNGPMRGGGSCARTGDAAHRTRSAAAQATRGRMRTLCIVRSLGSGAVCSFGRLRRWNAWTHDLQIAPDPSAESLAQPLLQIVDDDQPRDVALATHRYVGGAAIARGSWCASREVEACRVGAAHKKEVTRVEPVAVR